MAILPSQKLLEEGWDVTETDCWEYRGRRDDSGYGIYSHVRMHRTAHQMWVGPIPAGHLVRHSCDNPPCVNPEHLVSGTRQDNVDDMMSRRRHWKQDATHCINGHEYAGQVVRFHPGGSRLCRACERIRINAYRARKRAA